MNPISKIFSYLLIFCCAFLLCIFQPANANETAENTITILNLNNKLYYDVEIVLDKDNKIMLPTKQIADILEVPITINHTTKEISFNDVVISKTHITKNGQKLSGVKNKYIKIGLMDYVKDEIFCDEKVLSQAFETEITTNQDDLSIKIITEKHLTKLEIENDTEKSREDKKSFSAYQDVEKPKEKGFFSLDTVTIDNNGYSDAAAQIYQQTQSTSSSFSSSNRLLLKGQAFGGKWDADLSSNTSTDSFFSFSGLGFVYKNQNKKKSVFYELGKISGFDDPDLQVGTGLIGAQISDYETSKNASRSIEGEVAEDSLVNVYIDDEFFQTISTYKGFYTLDKLHINTNKISKLELKELTADKKEKSILVKKFPKHKEEGYNLAAGEHQRSGFIGISGYNNRLFSQDGYLYEMNSKKLTMGAREKVALKDNLTVDTKILYDRIISADEDTVWAQNYYNSNSILSMGTYQNPNTLEGFTTTRSINYKMNDYIRFKSVFAQSYSKNLANENEENGGYSARISSIFKKDNLNLDCELYSISPNFYLASSQYGFVSDRLGAKVGGSYKFKGWQFSAKYSKYYSNLEENYGASVTNFDEINLGFSGKIKNIATLQYTFNGKKGFNNIGENINYSQNINLNKYFRNGISLNGGLQQSYYSSQYDDGETNSDFLSQYSNLFIKANLPMPKRKGKLSLEHNIYSTISNTSNNEYNMIKFNYTFPEMKRFLISAGLGYKYTGMNKGFNYNATIGYRTKTGMILSLGYRFDTDMGYLIDNMYIPTSTRHSINFTVNDTFAVMPDGLKSVGQNDETKGYVEVVAYLDKNDNNVFDEEDVGVEDVPIKLSWLGDLTYTNNKGKIPVATANNGVYNVSIDNDTLQSNLSIDKHEKDRQIVLVQPRKHTRVDFKLISSVGNIKGNLKIIDDFGRDLPINDFIIVLHDEQDKEVTYSTVDQFGDYYFSGIQPGKYDILLDEGFASAHNLEGYEDKGRLSVEIPYVYKDFVDINDMDLTYKAW